jgi:hypothetical protein
MDAVEEKNLATAGYQTQAVQPVAIPLRDVNMYHDLYFKNRTASIF